MVSRTIAAAAVTGALLVAGGAEAAAPLKNCGSLGVDGRPYDPDEGGAGNFDIRARVTSCREARRVVRAWKGRDSVRGFRCRYSYSGESTRVTCTKAGGRLVRWRSAA